MEKDDLRSILHSHGFKEDRAFQNEVFTKILKAHTMPYVREHVVGTQGITSEDSVTVIANLDEMTVELAIEAVGYYEPNNDLNSDDGLSILKDAGVSFEALEPKKHSPK